MTEKYYCMFKAKYTYTKLIQPSKFHKIVKYFFSFSFA